MSPTWNLWSLRDPYALGSLPIGLPDSDAFRGKRLEGARSRMHQLETVTMLRGKRGTLDEI